MSRLIVLPLQDWPDADRAMWRILTAHGDPLDDQGPISHLRAASIKPLTVAYGRWLEWLSRARPEVLSEPPPLRATAQLLQAWIGTLADLAPMSRLMFVDGVLRVVMVAAPDADWRAQMRLKRQLKNDARRYNSPRKTGRVLSSAVLFDAALALAGPQANAASTPLAAAIRRRDGTMIALLALLPIRRRSLTELALGTSVKLSPARIVIALSGDMTKNALPWETPVPVALEPLLRRYIDEVRPWLMARSNAQHDQLWVNQTGAALGYASVGIRVAEGTLALTGIRVPPHFFRDAAATTLSRLSPESARLIRPLLAHSSHGTAERHYIHAQGIEAGRDYASVIAMLKKDQD